MGAPLRLSHLHEEPTFRVVRSLHAWSANATLLLAFLHTAQAIQRRAWERGRLDVYGQGLVLLFLLLVGQLTGPMLRWDVPGRALALGLLHALQPLGGAARLLLLGDPAQFDRDLLDRIYVFHAFVLGGLLFLFTWWHLARSRLASPRPPAEAEFPRSSRRILLRWGIPLLVLLLGAAAVAEPALAGATSRPPWPWPAWHALANWAGTVHAALVFLALTFALLIVQPWTARIKGGIAATQVPLVAVALASVLWV